VVAEGVEELGQWQFMLQHGCDLFQGYLFGRPVPIEQLRLGCLLPPEV
jgi:EAL domain-containing protein (putative c-di-GMP-specific phosphodiesterase class I)